MGTELLIAADQGKEGFAELSIVTTQTGRDISCPVVRGCFDIGILGRCTPLVRQLMAKFVRQDENASQVPETIARRHAA
jgi:hypothetical protein